MAAARPASAARRSSSPACAPCCSGSAPARSTSSRSSCARTTSSIPTTCCDTLVGVRLPPRGAGRAPRRGRPARRDHRRVPVDRRRADPHRPVGRRGRPADRRSASTTSASTDDLAEVLHLPGPRAAADATTCAPAPPSWSPSEPWGREQWERLAEGAALRRHGELAAVARRRRHADHRRAARHRPRSCWSSRGACATGPTTCSPRRTTSPARWRRRGPATPTASSPACTPTPTACSAQRGSDLDDRARRPSTPTRRWCRPSGWGPVVGDGDGLGQAADRADRRRVPRRRRRRRRRLGATRLRRAAARPRPRLHRSPTTATDLDQAGRLRRRRSAAPRLLAARRPSWRSSPRATSPAGAAPTASRGRASGRAPASSRTSSPATTSCTTSTASATTRAWSSARSAASSATTCSLAYKGGDKLYVPSDQIDTLRQYVGGEAPTLHRLGGADFAKAKSAGALARCARSPRSWSCCTRSGSTPTGHAFGSDTPWQHEMEDALPVRRDARPAHGDRRRQGRHGAAVPDGPPGVRRRRLRQDRGRDPRRVQGDPGRQAGRRARPDHAARHAARQHVRRPLRRLPDPRRGAQPLPHHQGGQAR